MTQTHTFAVLAYKESPYLEDCIDSLKGQTVKSAIILCSSTPSVFLENVARKNGVPLSMNPKKESIAGDWNFALGTAKTPYLTLAHQDDIYFPNYTEEIIKAAQQRKDTLILFSDYDEIIQRDRRRFIRAKSLNFSVKKIILKTALGNKNHLKTNKKRLLRFGSPIGCPTVAFHKNAIGNFAFDRNFSINMDWKAWHDLAQMEGSFVWVRKTLLSHRIHTESETSRGISETCRQREDKEMFEKFWPPLLASLLCKVYCLSYKNNNS